MTDKAFQSCYISKPVSEVPLQFFGVRRIFGELWSITKTPAKLVRPQYISRILALSRVTFRASTGIYLSIKVDTG
jgi:hypothetical protein